LCFRGQVPADEVRAPFASGPADGGAGGAEPARESIAAGTWHSDGPSWRTVRTVQRI